jgi:alkanesulfonate monooxygenase SsuD/methylene tetrahydromethanopterin reductase-like flavin-dependent oxidoreductase (luciferase family)
LTLAAQRTRTIKLGTGVAVAGNRLAPVTANAIATVNRLAPGRTFLGLGTGNTAMRAMGQRPMGVKAFGDYVRTVQSLLAGEQVEFTLNGVTKPIQFQNPELQYIDIEHHIPVHVSGFGPRAQALAGEIGDGLFTGIPRGGKIPAAMANVRQGAARLDRDLDGFGVTALINPLILEPGQTLRSAEVIQQCGSAVMANIHFVVDWVKEQNCDPPEYILPFWDAYLDFHKKREAKTAHQKLHQSHYAYLDPDEAQFITPEIIKTFCFAGHPEEVIEQLRVLEEQGVTGVTFIPPLEKQYRLIEDFARKVVAGY